MKKTLRALLPIVVLAGGVAVFMALKATIGLRVSKDEEAMGLDVAEHGMEAYGGFQMVSPGLGSRPIHQSAE